MDFKLNRISISPLSLYNLQPKCLYIFFLSDFDIYITVLHGAGRPYFALAHGVLK